LQNAVDARLGSPNTAHFTIHDDEIALSLQVVKSADGSQAQVGETIQYNYLITNSSNTVLTIVAVDDQLGVVAALAGPLGPGGTRSATLSHLVTAQDLANEPLVNTVVVTGTDEFNTPILTTSSAAVHITPFGQAQGEAPRFDLTLTATPDVARVGDVISLTYQIHNTGLVTITDISAEVVSTGNTGSVSQAVVLSPTTDLPPGATSTGLLLYEVTIHDWPSPAEKDVQVTATATGGESTSHIASVILSLRLTPMWLPLVQRH